MSDETAGSNGAAVEAKAIKEDASSNQPPTDGGDDNNRADSQDTNVLLSHVVPPSHILADGRFIQLPPPSELERSAFFERAVAAHNLISGDGEEKEKVGSKSSNNKKRQKDGEVDASSETAARDGKRKKKSASSDAPFVHPLAIASARLRAKGMDELSKAINLGGLVVGGDFFGLTNVVNQRLTAKKDNATDASAAGGDGKGKDGSDHVDPSVGNDGLVDESILLDQRLRSKYVLRRRQSQYDNASTVLSRHERRLSSSISVMRILDNRLRTLRKRWRLVAPEHGTRTVGPVRPREVVAVDVEVYDRDRLGGGSRASAGTGGADNNIHSSMGRIARRVPRFATMELDDNYDVSVDIVGLRNRIKGIVEGLKKEDGDSVDDNGVGGRNGTTSMEVDHPKEEQTSSVADSPCKTKAEPFAIADPTLGKIDPDFDPDKVPLLTLLFEIEKPSTGFAEQATLSSSFLSSTNNAGSANSDDKRHMHPDERVIEALQHSLFCASLFESMRAEIIPASTSNAVTASSSQQRQKSVAWLSSEMEESFLPPPSVMAGEDTSQTADMRLLCVIHCHEGEVKVQLDDEYSLTVKLIEAGTASAAAAVPTDNSSTMGASMSTKQPNGHSNGVVDSGSQSSTHLRTLCRALLLHSQSLYHEHCVQTRMRNASALEGKEEKPAVGFARTKKEAKAPSPHILQSCVGLGCKFIFEKKVRMVLKRLSRWLEKEMSCNDKIVVEWLPLALFGSHSRFALLFRGLCLDIGIDGDALRVTQTSEHGEFRAVGFGSELELEYFLKLEFRRALAKGNEFYSNAY
ncbi:hypothetical protein ACHAXR_012251 [Thalassiosira sp. AJA248-18]